MKLKNILGTYFHMRIDHYKLRLAILLIVANLLFVHFVEAGRALYCTEMYAQPTRDVFSAIITDVKDEGSTNSNPPKIKLQVKEILRGKPPAESFEAIWAPNFSDMLDEGGDTSWSAAPLKGPKKDDLLLLVGNGMSDDYRIPSHCALVDTSENRKYIESHIKKTK